MQGATKAGFHQPNVQSVWGHHSNLMFVDNAAGFSSASTASGHNFIFQDNGTDIFSPRSAGPQPESNGQIWIWGMSSTGASKVVEKLAPHGRIYIEGADIDLGSINGGVFANMASSSAASNIEWRDVEFTNAGANKMVVSGAIPGIVLWNVTGLEAANVETSAQITREP